MDVIFVLEDIGSLSDTDPTSLKPLKHIRTNIQACLRYANREMVERDPYWEKRILVVQPEWVYAVIHGGRGPLLERWEIV